MKIAIIGYGNVGKALAEGWVKAGHTVTIGARNPEDAKYQSTGKLGLEVLPIAEAVDRSEVVLVSIPAGAVPALAHSFSNDVSGKVFIDATNSVFMRDKEYPTGAHALKAITGAEHVVKGFNTTGFENMRDPLYDGEGIDMFTAGDSAKGKQVVEKLATDIGFGKTYNFGGDDKFGLIEEFAMAWINLAIIQKEGRGIAFRVVKRKGAK